MTGGSSYRTQDDRPNKFVGACKSCRGRVEPGAGVIRFNWATERWDLFHVPCVAINEYPTYRPPIDRAPIDPVERAHIAEMAKARQFTEAEVKNIFGLTDNKEQDNMQLFEYAVLYVPVDEKGAPVRANAEILVPPTPKLAKNEESLRNHVLREVDLSETQDVDNVEVIIRPFARY